MDLEAYQDQCIHLLKLIDTIDFNKTEILPVTWLDYEALKYQENSNTFFDFLFKMLFLLMAFDIILTW